MQSRNESQTKWSDEAVEEAHDTRVVEPLDCQSERGLTKRSVDDGVVRFRVPQTRTNSTTGRMQSETGGSRTGKEWNRLEQRNAARRNRLQHQKITCRMCAAQTRGDTKIHRPSRSIKGIDFTRLKTIIETITWGRFNRIGLTDITQKRGRG